MKPLKALSKQLFGVRYERISRSLLSCLILFFALYAAEFRIAVAPGILYLTATLFSVGVMWQALSSAHNAETFMGLFMLPFDNKSMVISYVLAFGSYTLITRTAFVLTLFFAIAQWNVVQILLSMLCACVGCVLGAVGYYLTSQKKLFIIDAYNFYRPVSAQKLMKHAGRNGSVLRYLLRYLTANKSYLLNTAGLWIIACFLPLLFGQFDGLNAMPLGFAILCLNTPISILLSCDPGLERAVRVLPGQAIRFCSRYCLFIFLVNMTASGIYLVSWKLMGGSVNSLDIMTAVLFALQSAVLSVLLEWLRPIRRWKIENDLWHHPRKYIVPLLMLLIAALIGTWPFMVWILFCIIVAECLILLLIARRT